jgi:hypothetical protein
VRGVYQSLHTRQRPVGIVNRGPAARSVKAAQNKDQKRYWDNLRRGYAEGTSDQFVSVRGKKQFLWLVSVHAYLIGQPKAILLRRFYES